MNGFDEAWQRWQMADQALARSEALFAQFLKRYLTMAGPAPADELATDILAMRSEEARALAALQVELQRCREAVHWI
jgi:hypothetical protein